MTQRKNQSQKPDPNEVNQPRHDILPADEAAAAAQLDADGTAELERVVTFIGDLISEIETTLEPSAPNPYLNMALHLIKSHLEGRLVTASALVASAGVPYATAMRKLSDMRRAGLVEDRARSDTGKSVSLHPSPRLIETWTQLSGRIVRLGETTFRHEMRGPETADYYFGGSYMAGQSLLQPPRVLPQPLKLSGGLRVLVHGDPTFMVMVALKRQFEQIVGNSIKVRAFSIDRLRAEALKNAERAQSRYDLIAVDLPLIGEFVKRGVLRPLDEVMDVSRLDPGDFHTAGWRATHWEGRPYGVPSQTTPELMFYRRDLFAEAGLEPPTTTDAVLEAAKALHAPRKGRYGIAWNAARGTALGHTFMMTCADFGQPIFDLAAIAGGYDADHLDRPLTPTIDTPRARDAAEYLLALMDYSPPDILSMSWYERVRPYAAGKIAMAYGYTLLAPYFELDVSSPAYGNTAYLPHPHGPLGKPIAPVGGYALGIPANLPEDRLAETVEALIVFTSAEAQKLYVQNGSRTAPRYSVGSDPEVRRLSPIFDSVEQMSWRDELQFWPRPPAPEIFEIIRICGHEFHDMLRGVTRPADALARAQARAEAVMAGRD
ncbi:Bacterial extracellular solute-binding protein [Roseivivax jejudonensis]|uniref:Bacterial extracellular solute-binding protein n=1 Tax=Roseivivax jejudonensis TaxID=1529041 RepID=A0A1X6YXV8_9RHOB|nr:sugar ABC transporter substrate-binding protein [Roseivivax jejudonensis]SLN34106.1 Bacterial extracellular solute-binding protein [Roseivivax jejudonensis]